MKALLDGVPIFFANESAIGTRSNNEDWFVGGCGFIEEAVEILAGLAGIHGDHIYSDVESFYRATGFHLFRNCSTSSGARARARSNSPPFWLYSSLPLPSSTATAGMPRFIGT